MTARVEVLQFPKLCPRCKEPARVNQRFRGPWWYECTTHGTIFFELQKARQRIGRWRWREPRNSK
jgi:hypothetical protein